MAITHNLVVTGTNDGTKQVSKNEWNDDHAIAINTILPNPNIADNADNTKDIQFTLSGATTLKTLTLVSAHTDNRTITFPDASLTLIGTSSTDTLTNKSIDSDNNTITNIVNADIKSTAGIVLTKLEAITSGQIIVGNGSNVAAQVAVTGDISISNTGVVAIATGAIVNGDMAVNSIDSDQYIDGSIDLEHMSVGAKTEFLSVALGDESTVLAAASTSVPVVSFHAPYALTLSDIQAGLTVAGTGAALVTVDVHVAGTTVMSTTKCTIDATEKTSQTATTAPVLSSTAVAAGDLIEVFVDLVDTDNVAAGLKVYLIGSQ